MVQNISLPMADPAIGKLILTMILCIHSSVHILEWWFSLQLQLSDGYKNSH